MRSVSRLSVIAATVILTLTLGASLASAQSNDDPYVGPTNEQVTPQSPEVANENVQRGPEVLNATTTASTQERSFLAFTGSDVTVLLTVGGIALVSGLALMAVRRRQLA